MKKRAEMRLVGLNQDNIFVQRKTGRYEKPWNQEIMNLNDFLEMMKAEFPEYYKLCDENKTNYEKANFFYEYGFDGDETFIFA